MIYYKILIGLMLLSCIGAREGFGVKKTMSASNIHLGEKELSITLEMSNTSDSSQTYYRPVEEDVCSDIVNFILQDTLGNFYNYHPCSVVIQNDAIYLRDENSFILNKKESKNILFKLKYSDFTPEITNINSIKKMTINFNFGEVFLVSDYNPFNKNLSDNIFW